MIRHQATNGPGPVLAHVIAMVLTACLALLVTTIRRPALRETTLCAAL